MQVPTRLALAATAAPARCDVRGTIGDNIKFALFLDPNQAASYSCKKLN
jgi:hypothetical protein